GGGGPGGGRGGAGGRAPARGGGGGGGGGMPRPGRRPGAPRRGRGFGLPAAAALLGAAGCTDLSPWIENHYVRVGAPVLYEPVHTVNEDTSGPYYGGSLAYGTLYEQSANHATALEFEYALRGLSDFAPNDGYAHAYYGGVRRFWCMDGRIRPHAGLGALWEDFDVRNQPSGDDPYGFGVYADVGLDYMITPTYSIGVRLRDQVRYEYADFNHGVRNGVELALTYSWNF